MVKLPRKLKTPSGSTQTPDEKSGESKQYAALKMLNQNTKRRKRQQAGQERRSVPKDCVELLDYIAMYDDGICNVRLGRYSVTLELSDINYQAARLDEKKEISAGYGQLLNALDPSVHWQITVANRSMDQEKFRCSMLYRSPEPPDEIQPYRAEMNEILTDRASEGQNNIIREKYVTLTADAADYESARPVLARLTADYTTNFKRIGCDARLLNGMERLELIHRCTCDGEPWLFQYEQLLASGLTTKHSVAPMSADFSGRRSFRLGEQYGEVLVLRDLPARLTDDLISRLTDLPFELTVTVHADRIDQIKAQEYAQTQLTFLEMDATGKQMKALQQGYDFSMATSNEQRRNMAGAKKLIHELQDEDQRLFKMTFLITVLAPDRETLDDHVLRVGSVCAQRSCAAVALDDRQMEGFNSTLPLGHNSVDVRRTMHTRSLAMAIPFTTQEVSQPGGINYGVNTMSRNMIFFSRYNLPGGQGWILGKPGGGKSMTAKWEIVNVLMADPKAEVIAIDPQREYAPLCEALGGEVIRISAGSQNHLNPMDLTEDYADSDDPLALKTEFVLSLVELLCGGRDGMTPGQRSVVTRACALCYRGWTTSNGKAPMPTLRDFFATLKAQPEPEAQGIALSLEPYIEGALGIFAHHTNVDTSKRFVVYDIKDLGKQLRTPGMMVVLDQIWNHVTRNQAKGVRTWIYIDEIQLLVSNEYCSRFFFELWSRARKWGAVLTGITQNVETLIVSDDARRMLSNSDFVTLLNQSQPDRIELAGLLHISNKQMSFITNSQPGHGLLVAGTAIVPFSNEIPTDTELYRLMSTKPGENLNTEAGGEDA